LTFSHFSDIIDRARHTRGNKNFADSLYPWRIKIKPIKFGEIEFRILIPKLKFIKNKDKWTLYLMGKAMREIPEEDYKLIEQML